MASLGGRRFTAGFVALLALGIAASYSNSLGIGFYFDDLYGIRNNPTIRSLRNIPSFFTDPHAFWTDRTQADVRPVLLITYALNYAVSGLAPWSYHVLNLLLHFVAALLVFVLVRDRTRYRSVKSYLGDWRRLVLPVLLPAALAVAYVAYRSAVLPSWTAETRQQGWVTPRIWFMSQWSALLYYVRLFVWPNGLSAD